MIIDKNGVFKEFKRSFIYKSIPRVREIIQPLKKLKVLYFSYAQITPDNKITTVLSNEISAINSSKNSLINEPTLSPKRIIAPGYYFPLRITKFSKDFKNYLHGRLKVYCCTDACIIIQDDEQKLRHIYNFAYNDHALIKYEFLEAFISYFHDKANYIIRNTERMIIPSDLKIKYDLSLIKQDCYPTSEEIQEFLKEIHFYNYKLILLAKKYFLSKRQIQVLDLILHNKITKQIAHALNLSPRTIEVYINNLKVKLKCKTKFEVVLKLLDL